MYRILFVFTFFISVSFASCQNDSISFLKPSEVLNSKRKNAVIISEIGGYSVTMLGLNNLWYKDYPRSSFHFFNDNNEWLQMDKFGHATTSYYVGYLGLKAMQWTGIKKNRPLWYGGTLGLLFLTSVEVFDGFSTGWGASLGDVIANTSGFGLLALQELVWQEQRLMLKFSTHPSEYAQYRPNLLGKNWNEQIIKDYNGQTYWLSANMAGFLSENTKVPKWLNLALGYGAEGMIGGHDNPEFNTDGNSLPTFTRYRQYFLSLDVDLTKIKTKSPFVNTLLGTFGFVKFPLPALEYNRVNGFKGHVLYF